jgi:RNA polymerase sigma-70 factor (ECF subfamily)
MVAMTERRASRKRQSETVERCVAGETGAWESLVTEHYRGVYFLCRGYAATAADAEDLTQDVFLKVFSNLKSFDGTRGSFGQWVKYVARNLVVDQYRRSKLVRATCSLDARREDDEEEGTPLLELLADGRPGQEEHAMTEEMRRRVHGALGELSVFSRDAIVLCDLEERDYKEAARILSVPEGTVKSRLSRGRAELARLLGSSGLGVVGAGVRKGRVLRVCAA